MATFKFTILSVLITLTTAKIYERCELARELKNKYNFPQNQIATWVCIAYYESSFNTAAVSQDHHDYGLFQIDDQYWCSPPGTGCGVACNDLLSDDITKDVQCVKIIYDTTQKEQGNGFKAWVTYSKCKNPDNFISGCSLTRQHKKIKSPKLALENLL